jgi:ribulose-bisphosphate carboxylase large chain
MKQLIKNGKLALVAYVMKPMAGYDYLATAAHFDAELFHGKNDNVCTTVDFTSRSTPSGTTSTQRMKR